MKISPLRLGGNWNGQNIINYIMSRNIKIYTASMEWKIKYENIQLLEALQQYHRSHIKIFISV